MSTFPLAINAFRILSILLPCGTMRIYFAMSKEGYTLSPFMYVIISAIAVFPVAIAFKVIIEKVKSNQMVYERAVTVFFLTVAIIEIIPILLVVYSFSQHATVAGMDELIVPGLLVLVFMAVGAFFIFLQGKVGVPEEERQQLTIFSLIAISLSNAIPIISIVGLLMMLP